jgi:hypothetical protein
LESRCLIDRAVAIVSRSTTRSLEIKIYITVDRATESYSKNVAHPSAVIIPSSIVAIAKNFQVVNNLDLTDIPSMLIHDAVHATLGLGVTTAEETLVEAIELILDHGMGTWNTQALELARSLPAELRNLYKFGDI